MSNIQWTEKTWNPTLGCSEISPGCRECYAAKMAHRLAHMPLQKENYEGLTKKLPNGRIVWTGFVKEMPERLLSVFNNKKPTTYFVDSMSDLFHDDVSFEYLYKVFEMMHLTPQHTYQVLTKRDKRLSLLQAVYFHLKRNYPEATFPAKNVWLGVSVEDEKNKHRVIELIKVKAAVKFLSCEPLLGPIDLSPYLPDIDWVITGGESGSKHRPCQLEWIESIVDQCKAANVPVFVKQLGSYHAKIRKMSDKKGGNINEFPEHLQLREFPKS